VLGTLIELCNPADFVCYITVVPQIYDADLSDPNCPVPGQLLCQGDTIVVGLPPSDDSCLFLEYWFPDTCCVYGPYFAAWNFIFIEPCNLGPCVDLICDTCYSWWQDPAGFLYEGCVDLFDHNWRISSWGLTDLQNNCPGGTPLKNHYKTWWTEPVPVDTSVLVLDQFEEQFKNDSLTLDGIEFLSNPVTKETFEGDYYPILAPDDHLNWYRTSGYTLIEVEYVNQFESTTVVIDSVAYLLVPAQKIEPIGHPPPESLDHYKCYRIQKPEALARPIILNDQFDDILQESEYIDTVVQAYFCTPANKNQEPVYDTITHYLAYHIIPPLIPFAPIPAITIDQFGGHSMLVYQSEMLLVPTKKKNWVSLCVAIPGDANASGTLTLGDAISIVNYIFSKPGWPPCPSMSNSCWLSDLLCRGDTNGSGTVTLADVIRLVNYIFSKPGGPWTPLPSGVCCQPLP
jgi:hypothetical protein